MLKKVLFVCLVLGIAIAGGAYSVWAALEKAPLLGTLVEGPWTAYPQSATEDADPYSRAMAYRGAGLPLGRSEGITFVATRDSAGMPLRRSCTYRIEGAVPNSRLWTLHAVDSNNTLLPPLGRRSPALHSQMVFYEPEGKVAIMVSKSPEPANWLVLTGEGTFQLVLTLLEASLTVGLDGPEVNLPMIKQVACDG